MSSFLIHLLFRNTLLNFQTYGAFEVIFLLLISGLFVLWSENVPYMISDFRNFLSFTVFVNISYVLKRRVFCRCSHGVL